MITAADSQRACGVLLRRRRAVPRTLLAALAAMAVASLLVCTAALVFALLSAGLRAPAPARVVVTAPTPAPGPDLRIAALKQRIAATEQALADVDRARDRLQGPRQALDRRRVELETRIARLRSAIAQNEEAAARSAADKQDLADRRRELLAEVARLEQRIAELKAAIAHAQSGMVARPAPEISGPQLVECRDYGILLEPQHVRIPAASMNDGTLVTAVRGRGAYFIVRPDGLRSFELARAIARLAGVPVTAEPRAKD
jgi:prefoldin subunit 5